MRRNRAGLDRWSRPVALLLVLAVTTGWAPSNPGRSAADGALAATRAAVAAASASIVGDRAADHGQAARATSLALGVRRDAPIARPLVAAAAAPAIVEEARQFDVRSASRTFSGRNHVWIPALGMSDKVELYACSRKRPPDNFMYRWGCAGSNNVYLLGHAYSVMKPLHDAYVQGRLRVGMVAIYADGQGRIRTYEVTQWRVVDPVDSEWAIASQPRPSMTLQTCVGKNSQWRLNVRLVATN
jgi:hypothetical protein